MNNIEHILRLHEDNHRALRQALEISSGNLDLMLNQPLSDVLRSLAQNDIRLRATNEASTDNES